jgi:hypothetical protein
MFTALFTSSRLVSYSATSGISRFIASRSAGTTFWEFIEQLMASVPEASATSTNTLRVFFVVYAMRGTSLSSLPRMDAKSMPKLR